MGEKQPPRKKIIKKDSITKRQTQSVFSTDVTYVTSYSFTRDSKRRRKTTTFFDPLKTEPSPEHGYFPHAASRGCA